MNSGANSFQALLGTYAFSDNTTISNLEIDENLTLTYLEPSKNLVLNESQQVTTEEKTSITTSNTNLDIIQSDRNFNISLADNIDNNSVVTNYLQADARLSIYNINTNKFLFLNSQNVVTTKDVVHNTVSSGGPNMIVDLSGNNYEVNYIETPQIISSSSIDVVTDVSNNINLEFTETPQIISSSSIDVVTDVSNNINLEFTETPQVLTSHTLDIFKDASDNYTLNYYEQPTTTVSSTDPNIEVNLSFQDYAISLSDSISVDSLTLPTLTKNKVMYVNGSGIVTTTDLTNTTITGSANITAVKTGDNYALNTIQSITTSSNVKFSSTEADISNPTGSDLNVLLEDNKDLVFFAHLNTNYTSGLAFRNGGAKYSHHVTRDHLGSGISELHFKGGAPTEDKTLLETCFKINQSNNFVVEKNIVSELLTDGTEGNLSISSTGVFKKTLELNVSKIYPKGGTPDGLIIHNPFLHSYLTLKKSDNQYVQGIALQNSGTSYTQVFRTLANPANANTPDFVIGGGFPNTDIAALDDMIILRNDTLKVEIPVGLKLSGLTPSRGLELDSAGNVNSSKEEVYYYKNSGLVAVSRSTNSGNVFVNLGDSGTYSSTRSNNITLINLSSRLNVVSGIPKQWYRIYVRVTVRTVGTLKDQNVSMNVIYKNNVIATDNKYIENDRFITFTTISYTELEYQGAGNYLEVYLKDYLNSSGKTITIQDFIVDISQI